MQLHVSFAQCHKCVCVNAKHMQVQNAGYNQAEQERIVREFCRSTCVTRLFHECSNATEVEQIKQGYTLCVDD